MAVTTRSRTEVQALVVTAITVLPPRQSAAGCLRTTPTEELLWCRASPEDLGRTGSDPTGLAELKTRAGLRPIGREGRGEPEVRPREERGDPRLGELAAPATAPVSAP